MSITFRPAVREQLPLLLGLAGGTGSGKTYSALELAKGLAQGKRFAVIDTENGRAKTYADAFDFDHGEIKAPFRPQTYTDAILAADAAGYPVVVVDSASHEWYGEGGCLDWHDEIMGTDQRKNITAWIEPKKAHKRMVTRLLQMSAHVILCFRAEPKVDIETDQQGRMKVVPKASLTGLDGWIPIAEKNLPYELTASFLLMADRPGVPKPIKLPEPLKGISLDRPLDADTGHFMAQWAFGAAKQTAAEKRQETMANAELEEELTALAVRLDRDVSEAVERAQANPGYSDWLKRQVERFREAVATKEGEYA
jgi:hypothetical protein